MAKRRRQQSPPIAGVPIPRRLAHRELATSRATAWRRSRPRRDHRRAHGPRLATRGGGPDERAAPPRPPGKHDAAGHAPRAVDPEEHRRGRETRPPMERRYGETNWCTGEGPELDTSPRR